MIKILVTGANGQLGRCLKNILQSDADLNVSYTDIDELDLTNKTAVDKIITANTFDYIINCAAYTAVDNAESNEVICSKINTEAIGNIAEAARRNKTKVIHISTDYVFNGENHCPYEENDKPEPQSVYGRTKLAGEAILMSFCPSTSIVIRTAWLYSEYGNNFVKKMLELAKQKQCINVVSDQVGTPTYAGDLAQTIYHIIKFDEWHSGIFHFTNEGVASWYDLTMATFRLAGINTCKVTPIRTKEYPTAAKRPLYSVLSKDKIKRLYNISIPYWESSLKKCINNLKQL